MRRWRIDAQYSGVLFRVRHIMLAKVHGEFTRYSGVIEHDAEQPDRSRVEVTIDATSIDTRDPERDADLQSPAFLDAARFPTITFVSKRVETGVGHDMRIVGDLTIRGVTREVTLEGEVLGHTKDAAGHERLAFCAKATIDRADFGLVSNRAVEQGTVLVGRKIEIELDLQATPEQS